MTTSSQLPNYSTDLFSDDYVTITIDPIQSTNSIYIDSTNMSTITLSGGSTTDTFTFNDEYQFNWGEAEEWLDAFPDWNRVQDMCKKYPGLEIALRNFKTVYTLVKDDYDNPKDDS